MADSPAASSSVSSLSSHSVAKAVTASVYELDGAMQHNPGFDEMRDHRDEVQSPSQETSSSSSNDEFSRTLDMDLNTVGVIDPKQSKFSVRKISGLNDMPDNVTDFSSLSKPAKIAELCVQKVPGWQGRVNPEDVEINQLCEGLSNQLFRVSLPKPRMDSMVSDSPTNHDVPVPFTSVLFRIYGKDAKSFYDPVYELKVFKTLSRYRIAPQLIAFGDGWRIEEWHASIAVPTKLLNNPSILCQIASQLGRFHKLDQRQDFPRSFSTEPATIKRLRSWASEASKVSFVEPEQRRKLSRLHVDRMVKEAEWLIAYLTQNQNDIVKGQGMDVVFSHNDVQENNILQTQYGLRLIDFEYAHYNYQAYDIANLFCEFTMDYTETHYPFFATDLAAYPDRRTQRMFLSVYLSEYLETPIFPDNDLYILPLMRNVSKFALASHLLWGLWSVIRAPQAPTYDDFDFLVYAKFRFDSYFRMKNIILSRDKEASEEHKEELLKQQLEVQLQADRNKRSEKILSDMRPYIGFFRGVEIGAVALSIGLSLAQHQQRGVAAPNTRVRQNPFAAQQQQQLQGGGSAGWYQQASPMQTAASAPTSAPGPGGGVTAPWNRVHAPGMETQHAGHSSGPSGFGSSGAESPWGSSTAAGTVPQGMTRTNMGHDPQHHQQSVHSPFGSVSPQPFSKAAPGHPGPDGYHQQQKPQQHHEEHQGAQSAPSGGGFADQLMGAAFNAAAKTAFGGAQSGQGNSNNDEMVGAVMSQVGQNLYQQAEESGWTKFVPWGFDSLRPYFNITHSYVRWKCLFLMIPFVKRLFQPGRNQRHYSGDGANEMDNLEAPTQRSGDPNEGVALRFVPDRRPDMYIPLMSFITYVLAFAVIKGAADDGSFHPDVLYDTATFAAVLSIIELFLARAAGYFVNMTSLRLLDLVCVIGYKYCHLSVYCIARILLSSNVPTAYFWWGLLGYLSLAAAYACLVSLQYFTTYKTAMQAHLEVSGSHTSVLIKPLRAPGRVFFYYAAVLMPSVAATKDIIRVKEERVRMLLKEQLGERQPLAGEYPCHSCTDVPACTLEELLADLPCPKPLTHRRVVSEPCVKRGQQLCATISPAGLRHGGAFRDGPSSTSKDPMKLPGHSTRQPTGHFDTDRSSPGHIRRFDVGDSIALQRGLEVSCNWELIQGPLRVIPDSGSSSSVSRGERTLVSADRLHQEVHRVKREERGPAREEAARSVAHEMSVSLTPLVTPRSTEGKTVSFGENCPALRRPLPRRKGPKRPPCGSWSDTEVALRRPGQRPSRSASMSPRLKPVTVGPRRRPDRAVGGSRAKLEVLPPWQPGKGYSEARRRALQQVRERYLLKRRLFKLWVEVKRDLHARKDTQKAVLSIRGKPPRRGVPPDVCHTRTSLLRNSVKLPAGPPPPATLSEPVRPPARRGAGREGGCAFCDHREVVSDVRARYAAWVSRGAAAWVPVTVKAGSSSSSGGHYLSDYTVEAYHE
ncbi:hypothetical protein FOZ62_025086 [Perkinsus olseni]|uniref:Choline/ethanolamine kinase n=1 Tax=Perkinsus olseni TaxID=32597 RepID=A0A7J6RAN6_PEROL|nr:hypothetical protein FOZ62_025086 [Perkinsus olseni]